MRKSWEGEEIGVGGGEIVGRGGERRGETVGRGGRVGEEKEEKKVGGRDGLEEWETVGMRNGPLKLGKNETDNRHSIAVPRDTRFSLVF